MLSVQATLFAESQPGCTFLGSGCYGKVFSHPDGETVIKRGGTDDGTLAYLYWCHQMQQAGKGMRGMPLIYTLTLCGDTGYIPPVYHPTEMLWGSPKIVEQAYDGDGYIVTMPKYQDWGNFFEWEDLNIRSHSTESTLDYMQELLEAWAEASRSVGTGWSEGTELIGDLHDGNFMADSEGTLILLDPSGGQVDRSKFHLLHDDVWQDMPEFDLTLQ